jgi:hypothetical protein
MGIEARVAGGCGDALEIIKNGLPDVVLLRHLEARVTDGYLMPISSSPFRLMTSRTFYDLRRVG